MLDAWRGGGRGVEPTAALLAAVDDRVERRTVVVWRLLDLVLGILTTWQVGMMRKKDSGHCTIAVLLARGETEATHAHYSLPKLTPTVRSGLLSVRVNCI